MVCTSDKSVIPLKKNLFVVLMVELYQNLDNIVYAYVMPFELPSCTTHVVYTLILSLEVSNMIMV